MHPKRGLDSLGNEVTMKQAMKKTMKQMHLPYSDEELLTEVLLFAETRTVSQGTEIILREADAGSFYYVSKGAVEVSYLARGTRITVAMIGAGKFLGEIGFLDSGSRVRELRVLADAELKVFSGEVMSAMLNSEPVLYGFFLNYLTRSICAKFRRILDESQPLQAYGASLGSTKHTYDVSRPLPKSFLKSSYWHQLNSLIEEIKSSFYNLSYNIQGEIREEIAPEHEEAGFKLMDKFNFALDDLQQNLAPEYQEYVWGYIFKEVFTYCMRSRFSERAYYKPKGYAGDFLMIEMLYQNKPAGDGKIGKLIDGWFLQTPAACAIRARRLLLKAKLLELTAEKIQSGKQIHILNLACGANRELFDFIAECKHSELINALCIDIDSEALQFTNQNVNTFPHMASIRLMSENLVKWSLGRSNQAIGEQDIIYSSGLTDYLEKRLFIALINKCYEHLRPGGVFMVGNFSPRNPNKAFMDHIFQWKLIHRSEEDMVAIFQETSFGDNVKVISEEQRINLFAVATKPA